MKNSVRRPGASRPSPDLYKQSVEVDFAKDPAFVSAPLAGSVTLALEKAAGEKPSYQWQRNGELLPGETSSRLTLKRVEPEDAGIYVCVYSELRPISPKSESKIRVGPLFSQPVVVCAYSVAATSISVIGAPDPTGGNAGGNCGAYKGRYVYYLGTYPRWGWKPVLGQAVFRARDKQSILTCVSYTGFFGDAGCGGWTGSVLVAPTPPRSPQYRFGINFKTASLPRQPYYLELTGFTTS